MLRVIGAGFGRTGTTSLKMALEDLGFSKCYHMREMIAHPSHPRIWLDAYAGKPVNWGKIFDGYQAILDWPGAYFYKELMAAYPEAKVILSVRDPERWYESMLNTIHTESEGVPRWTLWALPPVRRMFQVLDQVVWQGVFQGRFLDRTYALQVFADNVAEVQRVVPADRLLVYDVKEGWEPLCRFLGVSVPDQPFPRSNDAAERKGLLRRRRAIAVGAFVVEVLLMSGIIALLLRLLGRL